MKREPFVRLANETSVRAYDYCAGIETAKSHTMAWRTLETHNKGPGTENLYLKFGILVGPDDNYTSILQKLYTVGKRPLATPWILTNCHSTLAATGDTIDSDDHAYGLGCTKKLGGISTPPYTAVTHQHMREYAAGRGRMILGSDSHTRYGCLDAMGIGEGGTEIAGQALGSTYDIRRSLVITVRSSRVPVPGVRPTDIAFTLIGVASDCGFCRNKILEVVGDGTTNLFMEHQMGIDVMATETATLSSIWMTGGTVREWLATHGREDTYEKLEPTGDILYDSLTEIDLSSMEPMIALLFHSSNVYSVRESRRGHAYLDRVPESIEKGAYVRDGLAYTLRDRIEDRRLMTQQVFITGCAGDTSDNVAAVADILDGYETSGDGISLGIHLVSQSVFLEAMRQEAIGHSLLSGVTIQSCICGPCFGTVDVPTNNTLGVRHVPCNHYNREGFKIDSGQFSTTTPMDARSTAPTIRNGGLPTAATEIDAVYRKSDHHSKNTIYRGGVYNGFGYPSPCIHVPKGPNIKDWPDFSETREHVLLKAVTCSGGSTTIDELCPSGRASSLRSNPEKTTVHTFIGEGQEYVEYAGNIRNALESENTGTRSVLEQVHTMLGSEMKDISYDSFPTSDKTSDGSSRKQAVSNQKVLGGWVGLAIKYSTKRYRSNYISRGFISLLCKERLDPKKGDYLLLPDVSGKIRTGEEQSGGITLKVGEKVRLFMGEVTGEERRMLVLGGMVNYYRNIGQFVKPAVTAPSRELSVKCPAAQPFFYGYCDLPPGTSG